MLFEIATLAGSVFTAKNAKKGAHRWLEDASAGFVLGMWTTEIGPVGDLIILRAFNDAEALDAERRRALLSDDPFGSSSAHARLTMESYAPFPFLPEPAPRDYGGIFELRTYHLVSGGLPATLEGWKEAIGPAHRYIDHLVTAMYALDGDARIFHLWGFASVEERNNLRREHYASGVWPPRGGPENIVHAYSTLAFAETGYPIC
ncbi:MULTISPECIES: NIPSNAP family protein [unclassified Sphingomonas]|jgi:NIPSNAP|uniref:NIPSNAP family protein n=1 Tax=unclassified Sphingomonas TaxID=196159 RepID=UPI000E10A42F|nr:MULTISPECIES: NIPSNAP family protein [unclassified Sphingomonas]AXJ96134.1 NIPSNAP family protein [Sphingomonas sp. FARSPH]